MTKKLYVVKLSAVTYGESEEDAKENARNRVLVVDDILHIESFKPVFQTESQRERMSEAIEQTLRRLEQ